MKKEFLRSKENRLYTMGKFADEEALITKRKVPKPTDCCKMDSIDPAGIADGGLYIPAVILDLRL